MYNSRIIGLGKYVPENIVTNEDLSKIMDTSDAWITERTGIKERRHIKKGDGNTTATMALKATKIALERANIAAEDLDLILFATLSPDYYFPGSGVVLQDLLGIPACPAMDIRNQCSGFIYALSTADQFIKTGMYKNVLVVGSENHSGGLDMTSRGRGVSVIFGDGAGAVLLEPNIEGYGVQDEYLRSNGSNRDLLRIEAGGSQTPTTKDTVEEKKHFIYQDGKNVFKHAVSNMSEASDQIMKRNNLTHLDVNYLIAHQANKRIIDATSKRMGIKDEKVLMNIHRYGNTTAATIPLLLFDFESKLKKGDNIIFASFGAGFTWGAMYLKWAYNH